MSPIDRDNLKLYELVCQAQEVIKEEVLELIRRGLNKLMEGFRDEVVQREHHERLLPGWGRIYRWGYFLGKGIETTWGRLSEVRTPRLRGEAGEVRLFDRYEKRLALLAEQLVLGFGRGMSLRGIGVWLRGPGLPSASTANLGKVIESAVAELSRRMQDSIPAGKYRALVVDGVWGKKRNGKKQVLLVALGVLPDGSFEVLDWQAANSESSEAYEGLLNRLYQRGLETVEMIVGDEIGALPGAAELVYPMAMRRVCLYHIQKNLAKLLHDRSWKAQMKFRRLFWRIFDAETEAEAKRKLGVFARKRRNKEPEMVNALLARKDRLFNFFQFPEEWRHRVRTTNLGENFFRRFRGFLSRFPGWVDEEHAERILAAYLLSQEEKENFRRTPAFQLQLNFNRIA